MASVPRIGISGWVYPPWRGVFYPKDLPQKRELEYASRALNSIEINGSFYSLQRPASYQAWYDATPDDFVFSVKGGRFITHMKRLKAVEMPLATFLASGILKLREKLGPILWQFPPNFAFDAQRFAAFFEMLPHSTAAAATFAKGHDPRIKDRAWTKADADRPLRHAVEIRHESFRDPRFTDLLRKHKIALVIAETAGKWPMIDEPTADFTYARLHGDEALYVSGYTPEALGRWAERARGWQRRGDVYVYFDNDAKVRSPFDAMQLAARLAGRDPTPPPLELLENAGEAARLSWPAVGRRGATPSPTYSGERAGERGKPRGSAKKRKSAGTLPRTSPKKTRSAKTTTRSAASQTPRAPNPSPQPSPRRTGKRGKKRRTPTRKEA